APPGLTGPRLFVIPPSIDPLSLKNGFVDHETAYEVLNRYGVDRARPILTQVSRFDPWKDPLGVIDASRLARREHPGLQLFLVSSVEECAERASELLSDPDLRMKMGRAGRERVRERFLTLRELEDYVRMLAAL